MTSATSSVIAGKPSVAATGSAVGDGGGSGGGVVTGFGCSDGVDAGVGAGFGAGLVDGAGAGFDLAADDGAGAGLRGVVPEEGVETGGFGDETGADTGVVQPVRTTARPMRAAIARAFVFISFRCPRRLPVTVPDNHNMEQRRET
ncbi:MAG: hypothetical protein PHU08_03370 [Dehalococcoidales bacterium]|nr:hypothetical protein [Dehalococcoidales bacterium]